MYVRSSYSHQNQACQTPHARDLWRNLPVQRNSLPLGLGTGTETTQTCGVPYPSPPIQGFTILESSQLSSISHVLTPLVCCVPELHAHNLKIAQMYCAIPKSAVISRLARSFRILRMHSAISKLRTFLDCAEHIYGGGCHLVATYWHCWCEFS